MRIVYAHDAVVYTEAASDMQGLLKQRLRWKRGRFETFHDYIHMFFSMRRRHNKILTLVMLPLAMFSEAQLFCEFWFLAFLYTYSIFSADFSSFLSGILVVSSMFVVQVLFDDKQTRNVSFILLAPIGWLLFYATTFVETHALVRSIWGALNNQKVTWQRWQRKGVTQ
jgi:cellulose synthase/poly-beta-1,6-N-acetylglucosamine synthase-like glycosyltransferase